MPVVEDILIEVLFYLNIPRIAEENEEANLFKDPKMLQRFQDISVLPDKEKECLLTTFDPLYKSF